MKETKEEKITLPVLKIDKKLKEKLIEESERKNESMATIRRRAYKYYLE